MDKNCGDIVVGAGEVGLVMYSEPLAKAEFFARLLSGLKTRAAYVDFDLMYSGHVASGLLPTHDGVEIIVPERGDARWALTEVAWQAAQGRCLVVIDSLNGMRRACGGDVMTNSALMMLASLARQSGASVMIACNVVQYSESEWRLSPVGGRVVDLGTGVSKRHVSPADGGIKIEALGEPRNGGDLP